MGFLKLNRYGDPSGCVFDAAAVVEKARQQFLGVRVLPGEPLAWSAERAAEMGAADHVVRTLRRNQQDYGPACAFEIGIEGGETIQGRGRRYDVTFLFADSLAEEWRQRLLGFSKGWELGESKRRLRTLPIEPDTRGSVGECIYLALAKGEGCEMASADDQFVRKLRRAFPFLIRLADLP